MKSKQPIEPKPTQYGNILFRSRLEARWAVFLDFTENVLNWNYEPRTFRLPNGWTYTPDFRVKLCPFGQCTKYSLETMFLEVKPKEVTAQYRNVLSRFAQYHDIAILVVQGDFYKDDKPILSHLYIPNRRRSFPLNLGQIFANPGRGVYHAHHFRFDLKD